MFDIYVTWTPAYSKPHASATHPAYMRATDKATFAYTLGAVDNVVFHAIGGYLGNKSITC